MVGLVSSCLESGRNYVHHGASNLSRLRHHILLNRHVSVVSLVFVKTLIEGLVKSVLNLRGFSNFLRNKNICWASQYLNLCIPIFLLYLRYL